MNNINIVGFDINFQCIIDKNFITNENAGEILNQIENEINALISTKFRGEVIKGGARFLNE